MPIDWRSVAEKVVVALVVGAILGVLTLGWNWSSSGGLVRALGGVTDKELADELAKHPGPPGPPGTSMELPDGAIVAFAGSGECPSGWSLEKDTVGSAIVGTGATVVGETGAPLSNGLPGNLYGVDNPSSPPSGGFVPDAATKGGNLYTAGNAYTYADDDAQPISRFVHGVKTAMLPTFLPLNYCRKGRK